MNQTTNPHCTGIEELLYIYENTIGLPYANFVISVLEYLANALGCTQ